MDLRVAWAERRRLFFVRLLAGVLAASLPIMVLLAVLLTRSASNAITDQGSVSAENLARAATSRLEQWVTERHNDLANLAESFGGRPVTSATTLPVAGLVQSDDPYSLIELVDLGGRVLTASDPHLAVDVTGEDWFGGAAGGAVLSSIRDEGGHLRSTSPPRCSAPTAAPRRWSWACSVPPSSPPSSTTSTPTP